MPKTLMCDPALFQKDLTGRVYIVTGANSGSGLATTEQLVRQGATVVAACRRLDAAKTALAHLDAERGTVDLMKLDLGSLDSIRSFVEAFRAQHDQLHGLVNNAGVMANKQSMSADGFEMMFGVNHLGHFLLTEMLLETLKASAPSRIVCVSSVAHAGMQKRTAEIDFEDVHYERRDFDGIAAYSQSKLAVVVYARHLAKRLEGTGVTAVSTHPGWIRSNLVRGMMPPWIQNVLMRPFSGMLGMMNNFEGAQTQLHALLDDDVPNHAGAYYSQNSILYADKANYPGGWPMKSPNPLVYDDALAERLHAYSVEAVGLKAQRSPA